MDVLAATRRSICTFPAGGERSPYLQKGLRKDARMSRSEGSAYSPREAMNTRKVLKADAYKSLAYQYHS